MTSAPDHRIEIIKLESIDSTNRYALENADALADLTLVAADQQTAGRGRQGREWISPSGVNLYATWLLKSWPYPAYQSTWLASVALIRTLKEYVPSLEVKVKWPNDLIIGNRKLAGLLAECRTTGNGAPVIALGMGLNINMSEQELSAISPPAVSVFSASGVKINRSFFNESLAFHLISLYLIGIHSGIEPIFQEWKSLNALNGCDVEFTNPRGERCSGIVRDVTFDGEIVIETAEGQQSFQCGDIALNRESLQVI